MAHAAGYQTAVVKYEKGYESETILVDWGHLQSNIQGEWSETPADPLLVLIAHSDCDGVINVPQQLPLAKRLRELAELLTAPEDERHKQRTLRFATGLELAASLNEVVDFH